MRSVRAFTVACLTGILCACTAGSGLSGAPSSVPSLNPSWVNLYAADGTRVTVYKPSSSEPLRAISDGVFNTYAMAFDRAGDLYVLNGCTENPKRNGTVTVYAPGANSPLRTITKRLTCPLTLTLDAAGNLYVANSSSSYGVLVYAAGGTSLIRRISQGISAPLALAIDSMGNLYVANLGLHPKNRGSVTVYAPGSSSILRTITQGIFHPGPLALDARNNLYVANGGYNPDITVYALGSGSVLRSIPTGFVQSLAFDRAGDLYVGLTGSMLACLPVIAYASGTSSILRIISQGLCRPGALALDNSGNLYVGNSVPIGTSSYRSNVLVYGPRSASVLRTIKGIHPAALEIGP